MITSDDFVWLHFPKCAGTATERILKSIAKDNPRVAFDRRDIKNVIWHQSIAQREKYDQNFKIGARKIICNIRRLPAWLLSRIYYEHARPPHRIVSREMFAAGKFYENKGFLSCADDYAKKYSQPRVDHWIRTENFNADMQRVFSQYFKLGPHYIEDRAEIVNASKIEYIPEIGFYFTKADLAALYAANPVWAEIEMRVYGSLSTLD
jgi:hypothetical protein